MKAPPARLFVSRRHFLGQLSVAGALALAPRPLLSAEPPGRKLGVALVGLGRYSTGQLGPALKLTTHCRLAGVVTGSPEMGRQWAAEHGFPESAIYDYGSMAKNGLAPVAVTAEELPKTRPDISKDTEETIRWRMEWADGATAEFTTSYQQSFDHFRAEGARGWIHFQERAFGYQVRKVDSSRGLLDYGPPVNQQALQMDGFARHVQGLGPNPVPGEMGRRDLAIIEAIYASAAAAGKRVEVKV